ncbi:hypothetical protein ACFLXJ_03130 [Chloroflexota bacterium]
MANKDLCLALASCGTENEVIRLLEQKGYWDDPAYWRYFGDIEDNYSTIGNQQSQPEYALVEKIINSVDALLMGKCLESGIDPKSKDAPRNAADAIERFYSIPEGKLSKLSLRERSNLAENIALVGTGSRSNPCYSIIDRGEGQTPDNMPNTLLGLFRSIKSEIPFVQGKFHMGGTGAFRFCGRNHMQLIVSKRNPNITRPGETNAWGFSVVRREAPRGNRRTSVYTYLAPKGQILSFEADSLPLWPSLYPNEFGAILDWGTYIKLYEFDLHGLRTNVNFDLYFALSLLMPNIALPIRLYERRKGYSGHTFETILSGLSVRLEEDKRENLEPGYPSSHPIACMGQKFQAQVYAFRKGQSSNYRRNEGVIFTVNGQTHANFPSTFFQRESIGMGYLRDSLLVIVDCTDLDNTLKEDLFMNSRDRLSTCELRSQIERELERLIKEHPGLKVLRAQRRQEEIKDKLEESKPLSDVIEKVIKNSPTLAKLLSTGGKLPNPFKLEDTGISQTYQGKKYPTYFRLKKGVSKDLVKNCPINWRFRVQFETDAQNDYFNRDIDPGEFKLLANSIEVTDYVLSLWNGTASLTVPLPKGAKPNYIIKFDAIVKDATKWEPFKDTFKIVVYPKMEHKKGGGIVDNLPPGNQGKGKHLPSFLALPKIIDVKRVDWDEHNFDEFDALDVISIGEGNYDFYVNIDNICLQTELKYARPTIDIDLLTAQFRYGVVLTGMSLLRELKNPPNKNHNIENGESLPEKVKFLTRAISPILIPMISTLSQLEPEEAELPDTLTL